MDLLLKSREHLKSSNLKRSRKSRNKTTDIDLDLSSPYPGKLLVVHTKEAREKNSQSTITEENTRENNAAVKWKLTREDLIYNLKGQKLGTRLGILPIEFDEDSGRIWLRPESCKWKRWVGNAWIGFVGTRLISIIIALIYTIQTKEREGEFELYQQMLDTVVTVVVILIFTAYWSFVVQNLPSQTILSNQIYGYIGKGERRLFQTSLEKDLYQF